MFDSYRAWSSPDGEIRESALREELLAGLPKGMAVQDNAAHDDEHSIEGIAYFLKHARPDVEIVPVIVPAASFERLSEEAASLGPALAASMKKRGWQLGRDVAIVISADGTHYGEDFKFTPYGEGGVKALDQAVEDDRKLMRETLGGMVSAEKARAFYATVVDPANPDQYRRTWCGRFSVTFGTLLVGETAKRAGPSSAAHGARRARRERRYAGACRARRGRGPDRAREPLSLRDTPGARLRARDRRYHRGFPRRT